MFQGSSSKNIFMVKKDGKSISYKYCTNLFLHLRINTWINDSFAIKNDQISYFEKFDHASHLKGFFHNCEKVCSLLRICSNLVKKFRKKNFIFMCKVVCGNNPLMATVAMKHQEDNLYGVITRA